MIARLALLVACLAFAGGTLSETSRYRFDQWTTDDGLPQNSVREICQTRDGYLWFTTFDGLVRFDGVRFSVFQKANTPGIPGNRFISLVEARDGDLWASLETGPLVRKHGELFTSYDTRHGLPAGPARLGDDDQGRMVATYTSYTWGKQPGTLDSLHASAYRWTGERFEPAPELNFSVDRPEPLMMVRCASGDTWQSFPSRVVHRRGNGKLEVYEEGKSLPGKTRSLVWGNGPVPDVLTTDSSGRLFRTRLTAGTSELLSDRLPEGLWKLFGSFSTDSDGTCWIASDQGLLRLRRQPVTTLGDWETYPILERLDGSVWLGTAEHGLQRLKDGVLTREAARDDPALAFAGGAVTSLYEDRAGRLWVNGFARLSPGDPLVNEWPGAFEPGLVWAVAEDGAGALWRGTDAGVIRTLDGVHTRFTTKDGLAGDDTKVIVGDGHGGLWLGGAGGITHYRDGRFTAFTEKDGLAGSTVRALKVDPDGTLWIGTYDSGLGRLEKGRFTRYTAQDGLFDNGVFQILEDGAGWFWMSSNRGLYRVRRKDLEDFAAGSIKAISCRAYGRRDGLPSAECNGGRWPAGVRTRDGRLWFPTVRGVAIVDPATSKVDTEPPRVVIEEMRLDRRPVAVRDEEGAVRVLPGHDSFEVQYTALRLVDPENLRFRYRLEGADHGWVEAGTRRVAYYSLVPPGRYTFRVVAANADGVWSEVGASLRIVVVPSYHQTWWFRALLALLAVAAVAAAWRYRLAKIRQVHEAREHFAGQLIRSQESERKRIAAELHDSLGQQLLIVRHRAQLGQRAAEAAPELAREYPGILEQFASIEASAGDSIEEVRGIAQNLRPYLLDSLGLTKALEVMIEQVAATKRMRLVAQLLPLDDLFGKDDAITLYRIVQESLNNAVKHSGATEARVEVDRTRQSVSVTVRDDGRGFLADSAARASGFGLAGMAERVRMLGGDLKVSSQPGQGTVVTVNVPVPIRGGRAASTP